MSLQNNTDNSGQEKEERRASGMRQALLRELSILIHHPIYLICMVALPLFVTVFFTTMMNNGQPVDMPIGIVDQDNTTTTRKLTRLIDAFQSSHVVAHYPTVAEARKAMQRDEIYGFVLFPKDLTQDLLSARQPRMSVYYSNTSIMAGSLLYKEMKTMCTLAAAAVGQATLLAKGATQQQAMAMLQPIQLDTHNVGNPWINYNIYLNTMIIPASILLFVFLITVYSLGTELKFGTQQEWLALSDGSFAKAMFAKLLPQTLLFTAVLLFSMTCMFGFLHFPAPGGAGRILLLCVLSVVAAQGFAVFMFGLVPSLRMAMSVCSLWGVLSFSMVGSAFPVFAMDAPLQALSWMFPVRHYFMIYQLCVFNDYPLSDAFPHIVVLIFFAILPVFVMRRMRNAFINFGYEP